MQTQKSDSQHKLLKTYQLGWLQQKFPKVQAKDEQNQNFFISRPLPAGSLYSKKQLAKTLVLKQNASNQTLFNNKNSVPDLDPVGPEEMCSSRSVHSYRKRNATMAHKRSNPSLAPSLEKKPQMSQNEKSDEDSPFTTPFLQLVRKHQAQSDEIVKLKNEIKGLVHHNWSLNDKIKDLERRLSMVKKLNDSAIVENKLQDQQVIIEDLREQLKKVESVNAEDQTLQQKVLSQQETINEQSANLRQLQQKLESSHQTSRQLEIQTKTQKMEINRLCQSLQDKVKELNEKNNQITLMFEKEKNLKVSMNLNKKNMSTHKQKELVADLKKLIDIVKPSVSCTSCKKFYSNPVTLIPCAHSFCSGCLDGTPDSCLVCGENSKVEAAYQNDLVSELTSIFQMMQEMFSQLSTFI